MAYTLLSWTPIMEHFGAQVDIDLNDPISPAVKEELGRLFDERGMLLFRNQAIDYDTQRRTVSIFGNLLGTAGDAKYVSTVHDVEGNPVEAPRDIDPRATMFHSDLVFTPAMSIRGISLYAEDVSGGEGRVEGTRFVSTRQAYLDLPQSARAELEGRTANHVHALGLSVEEQMQLRDIPFDEAKNKVDFWSQHPLCYPSPRTGEPILLYVPWFTHSIEGLSREESQNWFEQFDKLLYDEEGVYTHRWQENDLLVWDNIALQHAKETNDDTTAPMPKRVLRRAILGVEQPNIYHAGYSYADDEKSASAVG